MDDLAFDKDHHTSYGTFDELLIKTLQVLEPKSIFDIGAGAGKVGRLVQGAEWMHRPYLTALEPHAGAAAALDGLYDQVIVGSGEGLYAEPLRTFDVVVLGDVIEHFLHSAARDLLEFLIYRSAFIVVVTPECMPMEAASTLFASHNSIWRPSAMAWHDLWAHCSMGPMHFYILRGYRDFGRQGMWDIVCRLNAMQLPLTFGNVVPRAAELRLHDTATREMSDVQAICYRPL